MVEFWEEQRQRERLMMRQTDCPPQQEGVEEFMDIYFAAGAALCLRTVVATAAAGTMPNAILPTLARLDIDGVTASEALSLILVRSVAMHRKRKWAKSAVPNTATMQMNDDVRRALSVISEQKHFVITQIDQLSVVLQSQF
uniref:Uncharacterized protein n=1 Tax=Globodera rostochiensis TaxID=31243 RepID=A0A914I657_GLORO